MATQQRIPSRSSARKFIFLQLVLLVWALGILAFFWADRTPVRIMTIVVPVLFAGNLAQFLFQMARPLFKRIPAPWNAVAQTGSMVIFGISAGLLTLVVTYRFLVGPGTPALWSLAPFRVGAFLAVASNILIVGTLFVYTEMRSRLEGRNRELQGQVQLGRVKEQMIEAELEQAHDIQVHLLPRETPQLEGFQIACAWQPARSVSGDYFDVLPLGPGQMGLCIADVSGKGITAALLMANLQASVKAFALESTTPAALCAKLNSVLCGTVAPGKFVTLFYAIIDTQQRRLQYENAGHCLPLIVRANGSIEMPASYSGVLGLFSHWTYADHELQLATGDCLVLVTDGVLEAANADEAEFGYQRLIEVVQLHRSLGAHGLRKKILEEVTAFCNGQFQDDASLILLTVD